MQEQKEFVQSHVKAKKVRQGCSCACIKGGWEWEGWGRFGKQSDAEFVQSYVKAKVR